MRCNRNQLCPDGTGCCGMNEICDDEKNACIGCDAYVPPMLILSKKFH